MWSRNGAFFGDQEKAATHISILTPSAFQLHAEEFQNASYGAKTAKFENHVFVLIRLKDAGDDAPSQKEISHVLVRLLLQGTLQQFNDASFLAHAKGQINALNFLKKNHFVNLIVRLSSLRFPPRTRSRTHHDLDSFAKSVTNCSICSSSVDAHRPSSSLFLFLSQCVPDA